ncbi:hypothetical protein HU200_011995 [Digitaria exilis]|uniref:Uncharacterized protein n=1 Tax=Digitaria exilis TaxID=1010633 RepID=A0A835KQ63_9POAL|nr:hypothetical protein HU200_011995 [Digitaria exilis]
MGGTSLCPGCFKNRSAVLYVGGGNKRQWSLCWLKLGEGDRALMDAQNPIVVLQPFYLQDYEKATDAFLDGLKLDPANVEIDRALWYCIFIPLFLKRLKSMSIIQSVDTIDFIREAVNGMKESHIAKQLSAVSLAQ